MSRKVKTLNAEAYTNLISQATQLEKLARNMTYPQIVHADKYAYTDLYDTRESFLYERHHKSELPDTWQHYLETWIASTQSPEEDICKFADKTARKFEREDWIFLVQSTRDATLAYVDEMSSAVAAMAAPSTSSLHYFLRYIPAFAPHDLEIYIESSSGFFGAVLKHKKTILNIQVSDNSDVIFSLVSPGRNKQFPSFTGEAIIVDASDTGLIEKLIRMIYD